jgi:DNA-binding response OmpR family regulator
MAEKKRILVVDDDKTILESLKKILEMEDFLVDTVETGKEALENLWSRHYHLIMINSRLPDITGAKLEEKIGEIWSHVKVIMLGMEPIDPKKLLKILENKLSP